MSGATFAPSQWTNARLIAGLTVREASRQRLFPAFVLAGAGLILGVQGLREFNFGSTEEKFIVDFGFGVLGLFGAVLAITATTLLYFSEIEQRTVLTVLAKPVTRGAYLAGKWLGVAALLAAFSAILTVALAGLLMLRAGGTISVVDVLLAGVLQTVKLAVLAALTLLLAVICRTNLLTGLLAFLVYLSCQAHPVLVEVALRDEPGLLRMIGQGSVWCLPDFQAFDLSDTLAGGTALTWGQLVRPAAQGAGYTITALVFATVRFRHREF